MTTLDTAANPLVVEGDKPCIQCSYNLRGLPIAGQCPECGTDVNRSLKGFLLEHASRDYLTKIKRGLGLVLNGLLLTIVVFIVSMAATFMGVSPAVQFVIALAGLVPAVMIVLGYWHYTEPDPGYVGIEPPNQARTWLRIAAIVSGAVGLVSSLGQLGVVMGAAANANAAPGFFEILGLLLLGVSLLGLIAWAVQFFAAMRYTRWLGTRVPDGAIVRRTRTYMWLLPVVFVVGTFLIVGPLIALVLYWNLLNRLRTHLRAILDTGAPASLRHMTPRPTPA